MLFSNPGSIDNVFDSITPDDFESGELSRLYAAMIEQYRSRSMIDAKALIDNAQDTEFVSLVTEIASTDWDSSQVNGETRKLARQLIEQKQKRIRAQLKQELARAEADGDQERADRIIQQMKEHGLDVDQTGH